VCNFIPPPALSGSGFAGQGRLSSSQPETSGSPFNWQANILFTDIVPHHRLDCQTSAGGGYCKSTENLDSSKQLSKLPKFHDLY